MNEVCRKYHLSESDYKNMLRDGILTTSVARWTEIFECYKKNNEINPAEAIQLTMEQTGACRSVVYDAVKRFRP